MGSDCGKRKRPRWEANVAVDCTGCVCRVTSCRRSDVTAVCGLVSARQASRSEAALSELRIARGEQAFGVCCEGCLLRSGNSEQLWSGLVSGQSV
jgi:hypothetical protein